MGKVEGNRFGCEVGGEVRFAKGVSNKEHLLWSERKVFGQKEPEHGVRGYIVMPVVSPIEPVRCLEFLSRKDALPFTKLFERRLEIGEPDMDLVIAQIPARGS